MRRSYARTKALVVTTYALRYIAVTPEDITFTSTDNYILSLKYNVASADYAKGSLTIGATYPYPFAITGNATLTNLYVSGGNSSYTSVVNVRKVTGNATFKVNYKA